MWLAARVVRLCKALLHIGDSRLRLPLRPWLKVWPLYKWMAGRGSGPGERSAFARRAAFGLLLHHAGPAPVSDGSARVNALLCRRFVVLCAGGACVFLRSIVISLAQPALPTAPERDAETVTRQRKRREAEDHSRAGSLATGAPLLTSSSLILSSFPLSLT